MFPFLSPQAGLEDRLRPALGHPNRVSELQALCQKEEERHASVLQCLSQYFQSTQVSDRAA